MMMIFSKISLKAKKIQKEVDFFILNVYINHFFSFFGAAFFPASFSAGAVVVATFSATTTGVNNPCLLCCSVVFRAPLSDNCFRTNLAIDPTTLNFSIT